MRNPEIRGATVHRSRVQIHCKYGLHIRFSMSWKNSTFPSSSSSIVNETKSFDCIQRTLNRIVLTLFLGDMNAHLPNIMDARHDSYLAGY
jgi:hypothetical protein